ncbi:hypothetical protein PCANC_25229 [Puccinia coronata f. sp. avenae]|uniref:Uncharacterized protein n=1 Tax=Puccinia coronata f. sp. avenae TaxID=200324 RepID=A0A2N5TKC0_9BASI|nr:hypothetical protein PCANC_25229 [Puccinia coronata f. sp. avenae]
MQNVGKAASFGRGVASAGGSALQTTQPLKLTKDLVSEGNPELFFREPGSDLAAFHPTSSLPPQPPTEPTWEEPLDQGAYPPTSDPPPPSANPTGFNTPRKLSGGISSYFQSVKKSGGFASTDGILEILKGTWARVSANLGDWSPRIVKLSDSRLVDERVPPLHGSKKINKDPPISQPPAPGNPAWFNLKEPLEKLGGTIRSGLRSTKRLGKNVLESLKGTPSTISQKLGDLSRQLMRKLGHKSIRERWTEEPPTNPQPSPDNPTWFNQPLEKVGDGMSSSFQSGKRLRDRVSARLKGTWSQISQKFQDLLQQSAGGPKLTAKQKMDALFQEPEKMHPTLKESHSNFSPSFHSDTKSSPASTQTTAKEPQQTLSSDSSQASVKEPAINPPLDPSKENKKDPYIHFSSEDPNVIILDPRAFTPMQETIARVFSSHEKDVLKHIARNPRSTFTSRKSFTQDTPRSISVEDTQSKSPLSSSQRIAKYAQKQPRLVYSDRMKEVMNNIQYQESQMQKQLSNNILPMLQQIKKGLSPVEVLGKRMATRNAQVLSRDQQTLKYSLLPKHQYLSKLLGLMGPNNVLKPMVELTFQEYLKNVGLLSGSKNELDLVGKELENLQLKLAQVAELRRPLGVKKYFPEPTTDKCSSLIESIGHHEDKLAGIFGSSNEFEEAIKVVEESGFYRHFMWELKYPTSPLGYELQFLQPWGHLHNYEDIPQPVKNQIYKEYGIYEDEQNLKKIMEQHDIVKADIERKMALYTKLGQKGYKLQKAKEKTPQHSMDDSSIMKESKTKTTNPSSSTSRPIGYDTLQRHN